jgi:dolichol-phosphate mannosyltransferase
MPRAQFSLIVPTLNEAGNLPALLARTTEALAGARVPYEVLIVDDGSTDGTAALAEQLQARYPHVRVLRRASSERGLSPSVVEGWAAAQGEWLGVMDADLQHPPELLPRLVEALQTDEADVVVASRYTATGERLRWNLVRRWISRGASNLAQTVLPPQACEVTDPMSGYFALRRRVIHDVRLQPRGYKILLEVLSRGRYRRVREVPYQFGRRLTGQSKLGAHVMWDYLQQLWRLACRPTGFGRFLRYCLIGASGVGVNLGVLWALREADVLGKLRAPAVAIECAILSNFLWNELWTFRDRAREARGWGQRAQRLASFNLICAAGAALHLSLVWALALRLGWPYMATNVLAIMVVTVWNYGLNTTWTWTQAAAAPARKTPA